MHVKVRVDWKSKSLELHSYKCMFIFNIHANTPSIYVDYISLSSQAQETTRAQ